MRDGFPITLPKTGPCRRAWATWSARKQLEPENNQHRLTGSVTYNKPLRDANWGTTLAWGQDNNTTSGHRLDAYLLESAVVFSHKHTVFARAERVQKDDLFLLGDPMAGQSFTIGEGTVAISATSRRARTRFWESAA